MFYIIIIISLILLAIPLAGIVWLFTAKPQLPTNIDDMVKEVIDAGSVPIIKNQHFTSNGDVSICFETMGNQETAKGTILLVTGHSQIMTDWYADFLEPLLKAGYHVVRYDNRGVGMSDWMKDWTKETAYTLEEMAQDGLAVLDALGIEKAHVIGMSMGGMIGQHMAINYSNRLHSLTSIMSTGYYDEPEFGGLPPWFFRNFVRVALVYGRNLKKTENKMKIHLAIQQLLKGKGNYQTNRKAILEKAFFEISERKGFNKAVRDQHSRAIYLSGSRYEGLKKLQIPTLVIHGTDDTLVPFSHAQKYAPMIPNAKTLFIKGMGHDLPELHIPEIMQNIFENLN